MFSLVTAWIVGLGVLVRAGALRLSARLARFDRKRIERLWGVRVDPLALPETEGGRRSGAARKPGYTPRGSGGSGLPAMPPSRRRRARLLSGGLVVGDHHLLRARRPAGPPRLLLAWSVGPVTLNPAEVAGLVIAGVVGLLAWPGALQVVPGGRRRPWARGCSDQAAPASFPPRLSD